MVGVVIIGVGVWILMGRGAPATPESTQGGTQTQEGGIKQLMAQGNVRCTVTSDANSTTSGGVVYVANGHVRGDFTSTMPEVGMVESHMLVRDGYVYTWSNMATQGIKMAVNSDTSVSSDPEQPNPYDANYNYTCESWTPDESQFAIPSTIQFMELNASAGASTGAGAAGPSCAQCDMVPAGPARDQCRTALGC